MTGGGKKPYRSPVPVLRRSAEFKAVYGEGKVLRQRHVDLRLRIRPDQPLRVGLTIPKRVGKAVERNRLRRRIREYLRLNAGDVEGVDVVFHCRPGAGDLPAAELREELERLWQTMRRRLR